MTDLKPLTDSQLLAVCLKLRKVRDTAKAEFTKKQRPVLDALEGVENEFLRRFNEEGTSSIKVAGLGTAFTKKRNSATVKDRAAFMGFMAENDAWDLCDIKANPKSIVAFKDAREELPPGVNLVTDTTVNVRSTPK